jgi:hypothetical protein
VVQKKKEKQKEKQKEKEKKPTSLKLRRPKEIERATTHANKKKLWNNS